MRKDKKCAPEARTGDRTCASTVLSSWKIALCGRSFASTIIATYTKSRLVCLGYRHTANHRITDVNSYPIEVISEEAVAALPSRAAAP